MAVWSALAVVTTLAMPSVVVHAPVRLTEMLYARLSVRLTRADGGPGHYGTVWGVWHTARLTPGLGYYQPDFQCAEYVMRSLRAAGYNIPTPPPTAAGWVDLVNVDRALSYLTARGIAQPAPLDKLGVGDAVVFHYLRNGPDYWSHIALVESVRPLRLAAHDRNRWAAPMSRYPSYVAILGLHTVANPTPPNGLVPLQGTSWGEVSLRDPPLRASLGGRAGRRLYLGELVQIDAVAQAPGSRTGWLHVASGPLQGWLNGDAVTRLAEAPPLTAAGTRLYGAGRARVVPSPLAVRATWADRLYVDAVGCPVPSWTGHACNAPYVRLAQPQPPSYTVVAARPVTLTLSPARGSAAVYRLPAETPVAAERVGAYAALYAAGGPVAARGVLYAPASAFTWQRGNLLFFLRRTKLGSTVVAAGTAAAFSGQTLSTLYASFPLASGFTCPLVHPGSWPAAPGPACLYMPPGG